MASHDCDRPVGGDRRQRGTASVEHDELGVELDRSPRSLRDVGHGDVARQPTPATSATDGRHPDERRGLEVVGGGVPPGSRQLDESLDGGRNAHDLGLRGATPSHRNDDQAAFLCEQTRHVTRHGRLADPLACPHDRDRGEWERLERRWVEAKVGAHVRHAPGEHAACESKPRDGPKNGLVGQVDDHVGAMARDRRLDVRRQWDSVVLPAPKLLLATDQHRGDEVVRELGERVAHDRGIVLAVDDSESPHVRAVTSSSMAPVYFAYSSVSSANETSLTWPWNGWRRQTSTRVPSISMTL